MDPAALAQMVLKLAPYVAAPVAYAVAGPMEEQYRKDVEAERDVLRTWQGGMTSSQRDRLRAEGLQGINAASQAQLARLARGAPGGAAASGFAQNAARDVFRAQLGAQNQLESGVRQQDIDLYNLRRRQNREDIKHAIELGFRRKQAALNATGNQDAGAEGFAAGQGEREGLASLLRGGNTAVASAPMPEPTY